jgi:hypothetical protein
MSPDTIWETEKEVIRKIVYSEFGLTSMDIRSPMSQM